MKSIGIKLADGSFYPLLEEGNPNKKTIDLTTVMNNQKKVQVDVYRTETGSIEDADYLDTLEITNLRPHQNGEPTLSLAIDVDENNELSAEIRDLETGKRSEFQVQLASRTMMKEEKMEKDSNNELSDLVAAQAEKANEEAFDFDNVDENANKSSETQTEKDKNDPLSDLPDFDSIDDTNEENIVENSFDDLPDFDSLETDIKDTADLDIAETEVKDEIDNKDTVADDIFSDMPDFDNTENTDTNSFDTLETEDEKGEALDLGNIDLPDFDSIDDTNSETTTNDTLDDLPNLNSLDDTSAKETTDDTFTDLPDFSDSDSSTTGTEDSNNDNLFDTSDLNFEDTYDASDSDENFSLPDNFADTLDFSETDEKPQANSADFQLENNMFSDLYDKETLEGHSSSYNNENETKQKTRTPVVICVVCAVICIFAVLLILFRIPSKLNFFTRKAQLVEASSTQATDTKEADFPPLVEPEPIEAKEDEIVVASSAEAVVPETQSEVPKVQDIRYKIIWGDTLWDISNAYYKTPWKYKWLAYYNNISNPDHILSGSWILIPAE